MKQAIPEPDWNNILAAWNWALDHADDGKVRDTAARLFELLWNQGYWNNNLVRNREGVDAARKVGHKEAEASLWREMGDRHFQQRNYVAAKQCYEEELKALSGKSGLRQRRSEHVEANPERAKTLRRMGDISLWQGHYDEARRYFEDSAQQLALPSCPETPIMNDGKHGAVLHSLKSLGDLRRKQNDCESAHFYFRRLLAHYEKSRDIRGILETLHILGDLELMTGNIAQATALFQRGMDEAGVNSSDGWQVRCLIGLVCCARRQGQEDKQRDLARQALEKVRALDLQAIDQEAFEGIRAECERLLSE